jgi:hypothetical protein
MLILFLSTLILISIIWFIILIILNIGVGLYCLIYGMAISIQLYKKIFMRFPIWMIPFTIVILVIIFPILYILGTIQFFFKDF